MREMFCLKSFDESGNLMHEMVIAPLDLAHHSMLPKLDPVLEPLDEDDRLVNCLRTRSRGNSVSHWHSWNIYQQEAKVVNSWTVTYSGMELLLLEKDVFFLSKVNPTPLIGFVLVLFYCAA
jgi:hypothetical protein